jgi:hypothetical protein
LTSAGTGIIAIVIGLGQGRMMRLESRGGALWGKMPAKSLWLWGALVVSRVAMTLIAHGVDAHVAASSAPILLLLGLIPGHEHQQTPECFSPPGMRPLRSQGKVIHAV